MSMVSVVGLDPDGHNEGRGDETHGEEAKRKSVGREMMKHRL